MPQERFFEGDSKRNGRVVFSNDEEHTFSLLSRQSCCIGALNDCFHIWHQGPFATINGFRVGRLQAHLVDWQEVNAAVGQAAIVLVTGTF